MRDPVKDWDDALNRNIQLVLVGSEAALAEVADKFMYRVRQLTPYGDPTLWKSRPPADYVPGGLVQAWTKEKIPFGWKISNYLSYAYRIEFGSWSTQAPYGMMRLTVKEVPFMLRDAKKNEKL